MYIEVLYICIYVYIYICNIYIYIYMYIYIFVYTVLESFIGEYHKRDNHKYPLLLGMRSQTMESVM